MNKPIVETLIVSRSAALQQGLGALLESLPDVTGVKVIADIPSAIVWIESRRPGIVFLDMASCGSQPEVALEKIHAVSPETKRVLLVDDVQHVNLMPGHAEAVLIKGISPTAVAAMMTRLLSTKGEENEHNDSNP